MPGTYWTCMQIIGSDCTRTRSKLGKLKSGTLVRESFSSLPFLLLSSHLPPLCFSCAAVGTGIGHFFALVGDEQVWLQEDDGRVPKGGEGANSLRLSLTELLLPLFYIHRWRPPEESGCAEMSQGHIKKARLIILLWYINQFLCLAFWFEVAHKCISTL